MNEIIPFAEVERMGQAIAKSGLFGMKTPESVIALMIVAQAQGRHPATVAMEYDIIQGKPALKSQAALMRFQESGGRIEYITRTDDNVTIKFVHCKGGELVVEWTMKRAKAMGLDTKDNWRKQPMIMLQWRCIAEGVRACYPACLSGSYLVEEVQDFDAPKRTVVDITEENGHEVFTSEKAESEVSDIVGTFSSPAPLPASITNQAAATEVITEAQRKRLFTIATQCGVHTSDVKTLLLKYGFDSSKIITTDKYDSIIEEIEGSGVNGITK